MNLEMDIEIHCQHGLHIRPCASLVKICSSDKDTEVLIKNLSENTTFVDGKSMMQVSSLRAACGQKLHFVFKGENPKPLAEKVADFFSRLD